MFEDEDDAIESQAGPPQNATSILQDINQKQFVVVVHGVFILAASY